jgi:hypothetical protein
MTQGEKNKKFMIQRVVTGFFKDQEEFCNSVPALDILGKKIISNYKKIDECCIKIEVRRKFRDMKLENRRGLCDSAYTVSSGLLSHATVTKNKVLESAVNYCFSDFYRSVESTMLARCKQILRMARRTKNLDFVGLTDNLINELEEKIKKYEDLVVLKDMKTADFRKHNRIASKLLRQTMHIFEVSLNPLMRVLVKTHPGQTRVYFFQSEVNKKAGRKKKRNKKQQSKTKTANPDILQQKTTEELLHRFTELAVAE